MNCAGNRYRYLPPRYIPPFPAGSLRLVTRLSPPPLRSAGEPPLPSQSFSNGAGMPVISTIMLFWVYLFQNVKLYTS